MLVKLMPWHATIRVTSDSRMAALGLPLLLYFGAAALLFGHGSRWCTGTLGVGEDPVSFVWFLNWWPFAVRHGLNPFVSHYIWAPHGINLTWATSIPALAFVMAPVTYLTSPIVSFNLLTIAAPALAAWSMFLLCEDITHDWPAAFAGGYLFGFSSYEIGQLTGHLNLDFICLVPLIALVSIRRARGDLSGRAYVAALTACLLAELGISTEILATLCVFGAMTWSVYFLFARRGERAAMLRMAGEILLAAILTMFLAAPFFYYLFKGLGDVPPAMTVAQNYVTDPRNFFIPTGLTWLTSLQLEMIAQQFDGNASEQGAYLGLPLIALAGLCFITCIRQRHVLPLLLVTILLMIFSLGPHLQMGRAPSDMPLPWLISQHLPFLSKVLPARFSMYVALCCSIAAALMLAGARGWRRGLCYLLAVAAGISLLPNPAFVRWYGWPSAAFITPQAIGPPQGHLPNVLVFPFGQNGPGMAWQLDAKMNYVQTGGYASYVPESESAYPAFNDLAGGVVDPDFREALDRICAGHRVNYILLGPDTPPAITAAVTAQGWRSTVAGSVTIVKVPPAADMDYYILSGDYWGTAAQWNWMGRKITVETRASPVHLKLLGVWTKPSATLRMTVVNGGVTTSYPITRRSVIAVDVPPRSAAVITANETWVPGGADPRALSVVVVINAP